MAYSPNSSSSNHVNGVGYTINTNTYAKLPHASLSNKDGDRMTKTAKSMLKSQLLYASSISDRLMPKFNHNKGINHGSPNPQVIEIDSDSDDEGNDWGYEGQIHSLPYTKHGPYTCPKCMKVLPTSQHFAAHVVADHYKYETKEQRRKRQIAKVRKRALKLEQVNDGLTCVPIFYEWEDTSGAILARNNYAEKSTTGGGGAHGGGRVKAQSTSGEKCGNDSVVPPGFANFRIKRQAGGFSPT